MATAFAHIVDDVTCSLCLDVYQDPKILACGHSFCKLCLQNHINSSNDDNNFVCPVCGNIINISHSTRPKSSTADEFPENITLMNIISTLRKTKISDDVHPKTETLQSICEALKSLKCNLTENMESKTERIRRDLKMTVDKSGQEIDRKVNELTQSIQEEGKKLKKELEKSEQNIEKEIANSFKKHRELISACQEMIKFGEDLSVNSSADKIQENISTFVNQRKEISDFLSKDKKGQIQVVEVQKANIKSVLETQSAQLHLTCTRAHRETDRLKIIKIIDTQVYYPCSILVLGKEKESIILLTDYYQKSVKCFSFEDSKCLSEYKLESQPFGLCESPDSQVVITLPYIYTILYLQLKGEFLHVTKTLKTDKKYRYISMLPGNHLAVSYIWWFDNNYVDILDGEGHIIQSFSEVFENINALTVTGQSLFVVSTKTVTYMTLSGVVTWRSHLENTLFYPLFGVTCDPDGFVYVCSFHRNCIVQLSADGEIVQNIITDQDGLYRPLCVCFHKNVLYAAQQGGQVKIFTWSKE